MNTSSNYYQNNRNILLLFVIFIISRIIYYKFFNITFDSFTLNFYWQYFPKDLLRNDLINSIIYNHFQAPFLNLLIGSLMKITDHYIFILQLIYLLCGFGSFVLIYLIAKNFEFKEKNSLLITIILMVLPTSILYENHLYKEYLTFFFILLLFYSTFKIYSKSNSIKYVLLCAISLSLLSITRETFHIFWGYLLIFFIRNKLDNLKKILLILIFTISVLPFYVKNLILYDKFGINVSTIYEHLNQKIDYVKEMKDPKRHERLREIFFGSHENYIQFTKKGSILYDVPIYSPPSIYKKKLNYKNKYKNKLLNTNALFSEVLIEVDKYRKKDFFLILKEKPLLLILNVVNSITRHLFFSSDHFSFTKHNADKMKPMIKISDCLKLTPICLYDFNFDKIIAFSNLDPNLPFETVETGTLSYKEKILYSFQYTNFLLVIIYLSLLLFLIKDLFILKSKKIDSLINFWLITFIYIFFTLVVFEDGEISRHRFPFDYLCFLIFLKKLNTSSVLKKIQINT